MATPFGSGMGRSEDVCGALAGGALAIGALSGKTRHDEGMLRCYEQAHSLYSSLVQRFGAAGCRALDKGDFKSPELRIGCSDFVREACRSATEIVRKHD
ncbi:MAG: C_GCAxxG_C_C family protein [Candidatus Thermoplasmatota archaeon]|nr:C_GCAxxG_C_C family protein [Candidatus Thermoplasmatota archaeon]